MNECLVKLNILIITNNREHPQIKIKFICWNNFNNWSNNQDILFYAHIRHLIMDIWHICLSFQALRVFIWGVSKWKNNCQASFINSPANHDLLKRENGIFQRTLKLSVQQYKRVYVCKEPFTRYDAIY